MINKDYTISDYIKSKDYVKSPLRYAGGKFYAIKHILPFIDCVDYDEYREPFVGGGSVFFAKAKVDFNWINDIEPNLINLYECVADESHAEQLIEMLKGEVASKERHLEVKKWVPSNSLEEAYRTFYLNRTSYCGIINVPAWGYKEGKSAPPQNWGKFIKNAHEKLKDTTITRLDFENVIKAPRKGRKVLLYLDPPYYKADQKRAYIKSFTGNDHLRLAKLLKRTDYHFCLSYDDVREVRDLYAWAYVYEKKWLYNTVNSKGEARNIGNELIITNYKVVL